jgi:hypothetical protein
LAALVGGTLDELELQGVERTAYGLQSLDRHMQIAGGGTDIGVAQQNLDGTEIGAGVEHVGGAGVAKQVRIDGTSDAGAFTRIAAKGADSAVVQGFGGALFGGEEPLYGSTPAEIDAQPLKQCRRQGDFTFDATLTLADMNDHAFAVEVGGFQMAQFIATEACGVEGVALSSV